MPNLEDWSRAVDVLVQDTAASRVRWTPITDFSDELREEVLRGVIYTTNVRCRNLFVYEYRYKTWMDEDTWRWEEDVAIEFVDDDWRLQWQWPQSPRNYSLLEAIRYQIANAESFLTGLLKDAAKRKQT